MARPPEEGEGKLGGRVFQRELMMYPQARGLLRGLYEPSGSACPSFLGFPAKTHAPSVPGQLGCRRPSRTQVGMGGAATAQAAAHTSHCPLHVSGVPSPGFHPGPASLTPTSFLPTPHPPCTSLAPSAPPPTAMGLVAPTPCSVQDKWPPGKGRPTKAGAG